LASNALHELEHRLRMFAEQAEELAIILLDADRRVRWWSPGAERIFGYPGSEILGQNHRRLFVPEDNDKGLAEHEAAVAADRGTAEDDRWMERADGSRFWASGMLIAIRDPAGELIGFTKVLRDRTDFREQLETARNQAAMQEEVTRRKDVFLSTLSHELRNPLAPLANAVHIIRMSMRPAPPDVDYALKVVERQVDLLRRLVDDLLDLTRIGAGKIALQRRRVPLHELVERSVEATASLVKERNHRLDVLLPPAPIVLDVDPDRMVQVFTNLLNNAAKYTPPGGRIWIKATVEDGEAVIRFEDNGVGIPIEMLPLIFELFTQVESARRLSAGGLGIGLALVKDLVAQHGGSVTVRSEGPGKGSDFAVRLPMPRD
jgi:PAS domain S-box-containing protein